MPKHSSLPKYRLHRASGQAVVTLAGRDYYLGPHGTGRSRQEYERLLGEWLACGRRPFGPSDDESFTVSELAAAYLKFATGYYRKNGRPTRTIERVKLALRLLRRTYGHTDVKAFGPLALQAIQQQLVREGKARPYINDLVEEVRRVFKWGVAQELVPASTHHALSAVSGLKRGRTDAHEPDPIKPVSDATINATIPFLSPTVADMARLQRLTAMRPGEVCIVRPCDIDRGGEIWTYRPHCHKTEHHGRDRLVFLGPKAQQILLPYLSRSAQDYCFSPRESEDARAADLRARRKTAVQPSQRNRRKRRPQRHPGARYSAGSYGRAIARACDKAWPSPQGLDAAQKRAWRSQHRWTPNQLRHTGATEIRAKFGLEGAQTILGHAHVNTTEVYAERDAARAIAIMREVG